MTCVESVPLQGSAAVLFARFKYSGATIRRCYVHSAHEACRFLNRSKCETTGSIEAIWFGDRFKMIPDSAEVPSGMMLIEYEVAHGGSVSPVWVGSERGATEGRRV